MGPNEREPELQQPEDAVMDLEPDEQAADEVAGGSTLSGGTSAFTGSTVPAVQINYDKV